LFLAKLASLNCLILAPKSGKMNLKPGVSKEQQKNLYGENTSIYLLNRKHDSPKSSVKAEEICA